jgi:outer membrane protein assembly factor BamD (BamD/ComL family)
MAVLIFSCVSQSGNDLKKITAKENEFASKRQDIRVAQDLDRMYKSYIARYPSDTNIPRMLFEDAQVNDFPLHKTNFSLEQLEKIYDKYPDSKYAPEALLKAAFLNETALLQYDKAKILYTRFIQKYPNHPLANDARISLENIGLTPEQQFKKIQETQDSVKNQKKMEK